MSAVLVIDRRKGEGVYFKGNAKCKMQKCKIVVAPTVSYNGQVVPT